MGIQRGGAHIPGFAVAAGRTAVVAHRMAEWGRLVHRRAGGPSVGYWKDQLLKQQEQGWSSVDPDLMVCASCFEDYAIQNFIRDSASGRKCSYCGRRAKKAIAVPINDVLELIGEGLGYEYADPAEQNPWDEGGYVFPTMNSRELFDEIGQIARNEDVQEEIVEAFGGGAWNEKDLFGLWEGDALRYGWSGFVKAVKYQRRYVFLRPKKKGRFDSEVLSPDKMLDRIGEVINEVDLVQTMKAGTRWLRARVHDPAKKYTSAADLGTAPLKTAVAANRMSPAGIPMFYGAADVATAIAETYTPTPGTPATVTVAKFETAREACVVDFTVLPPVPSLFDEERRHLRAPISFLWSFVRDLAKPIQRDGREHIEYVPTQIVTEYLRHVFRSEDRRRVRGVIYQSSRNGGGKCCVLFVSNKQCGDGDPGWQDQEIDRTVKKRKKYWVGLVGKPRRHNCP